MIKIENTVTPSPAQWKTIVMGMRNPMNSWVASDSYITHIENPETLNTADFEFVLGEKDAELMRKLADLGPVHGKFMRMIVVYVDITAPLYWWKEFDTYKVGTVVNSCSTMHKIADKRFEREDFSVEHLKNCNEQHWMVCADNIISALNVAREKYLETKDKTYWWKMIQLLPSSYNQKRTIKLNYEVLRNIYKYRKGHKLDEWHDFCYWIEGLPYNDILITGGQEA